MRIRLVYHRSDGSFCDLQLRDDAQFYVLSDAENAGIEFALIKDGEIFAEILRISACADDRLPPPVGAVTAVREWFVLCTVTHNKSHSFYNVFIMHNVK
ncbi:MAG: hypothetical protein IJT36_04755 [Alphaproteobacteria bacterium]|nr:hypothetical protein [Alphaproteobacteria bacterium]